MSRCEDERMWRWEDVKMSRCEDERMWRWEGVKMRGCEDEKMFYRPPLLEEPCAQTLSGTKIRRLGDSQSGEFMNSWEFFTCNSSTDVDSMSRLSRLQTRIRLGGPRYSNSERIWLVRCGFQRSLFAPTADRSSVSVHRNIRRNDQKWPCGFHPGS